MIVSIQRTWITRTTINVLTLYAASCIFLPLSSQIRYNPRTNRHPVKNRTGIRLDYKDRSGHRPIYRPNPHWRLRWLAFASGCVLLGVVMAKTGDPASGATSTLGDSLDDSLNREAINVPPAPATDDDGEATAERQVSSWRQVTVDSGDTFARLLRDAGVASATIHALASAGEAGRAMSRIYPGDSIRLGFDTDETLIRLQYRPEPDRLVVFERSDEGFEGKTTTEPLQRRLEHAHGEIDSSLFRAGAQAGLSDRLILDLVDIFGWDIDFVLDIRRGDRFSVVYETFYKNGDRVRTGEIVAAEFINRGETYRALRYTDPNGATDYFAPDGDSMRKAFLRTPVKFTRISSGFGRRYHPTLHRMRNHNGVDYAAPRGTPIRATGSGRIDYRGYNGGYGRMIVIRHGEQYSTAYAHMARYNAGTRPGQQVEQGQIIGYVGSTGRSTGPHLHYEFRVNGRHRNPLTVQFPSVDPVAAEHREDFQEKTAPLVAQLETLHRVYAQRPD